MHRKRPPKTAIPTIGIREIFIVVLLASGASACGSPTAETCVNGVDQYGRGPTVYLTVQCSPLGSNLQCVGNINQGGYCANTSTITGKPQWISLEADVAAFEDPAIGFLKVLTAGVVEVMFKFGPYSEDPIAFAVAPATAPERMLKLGVVLFANTVSSTSPRVEGVALDVQPDRGAEQTCQTSKQGSCEFMVLSGNVHVIATKAGYAPLETTAAVAPRANNVFEIPLSIALTPLPPS